MSKKKEENKENSHDSSHGTSHPSSKISSNEKTLNKESAAKKALKLRTPFWHMFISDLIFVFIGFWIVALFAWILRIYLAALSTAGNSASKLNTYLSQGFYTEALSGDLNNVQNALNSFLLKAIPTLLLFLFLMLVLYTLTNAYGWNKIKGRESNFKNFKGHFFLAIAWSVSWMILILIPLFLFKENTNVIIAITFILMAIHMHNHIFYSFDEQNVKNSLRKGFLRAFSIPGIISSLAVAPFILSAIVLASYLDKLSIPIFLLGIAILLFVLTYSKIVIYNMTCKESD